MNQHSAIGFWVALIGLVIVYISGLFIDIMDVDAAQYASISREMLEEGNWLQIQHRGNDYLDKPPLLFWTSALSFAVFGINNFAYKLPSLLFSLLGFYSTFRFAKLYYDQKTAALGAIILASTQALIMINNDVRTDTMLTACVIFSCWQIATYLKERKLIYLVGISIGLGLGMLSKGPLAIMIPAMGFGVDWLLKRQWRNFFRPGWLLVIGLVALFLAPAIWGLQQQYGSDGPYFFLWAQSFGRLTGDNPFINSMPTPQGSAPFYFVHTFLWTFAPWSLMFIGGFILKWFGLFKDEFSLSERQEFITAGGFLLGFLGVSMSDYKLPHYIYPVFPFAAIIASNFLTKLLQNSGSSSLQKVSLGTQVLIGLLICIVSILVPLYIFPGANVTVWIILISALALSIWMLTLGATWGRLIGFPLVAIICLGLISNLHGYPKLLSYQSTIPVAQSIKSKEIKRQHFRALKTNTHSLDFYTGYNVTSFYTSTDIPKFCPDSCYLYTTVEGVNDIQNLAIPHSVVDSFDHYNVAVLRWPFLNPKTRKDALKKMYLVKVKP